MKQTKWIFVLLIVIVSTLILKSCKKKEEPELPTYDLFPLKVGDEFYYSYSYSTLTDGPFKKSNGRKKWKILTDSLKDLSVEYLFEEKYNGMEINKIVYPNTIVDTITINDSIRYFKVIEDKSGQLSFWNLNATWNITLQRHQRDSDIFVHNWIGTSYQRDYQFHANKGLIDYINGKGPIANSYSERYKLDSVKLIH